MAPVRRRASSASGLLKRNMRAATGVRATTGPPSRAALAENQRRTVRETRPAGSTPSRAWGTSMLHELKPKIRPEISITHNEAGGLSTVMKLDESEEPKKKADRKST